MEQPTYVRAKRHLYRELATILQAIRNCKKAGNSEWLEKHHVTLKELTDMLPSGSGIDNGTRLKIECCTADKLVFTFGYHHMNDAGMYNGWTEHQLIITPSFDGINMKITGRDRNQVKDYLYETYEIALAQLVD